MSFNRGFYKTEVEFDETNGNAKELNVFQGTDGEHENRQVKAYSYEDAINISGKVSY